MSDVRISARSWHRFNMNRLSVTPELIGAKHAFTFENRQTEAKLPSLERNVDGTERTDKIECLHWRRIEGVDIPQSYHVSCVDFLIDLDHTIDVPSEALVRPPTQMELFTERQKSDLKSLTAEHEAIAARAVSRWLKILRWKTRIGYIAEPQLVDHESGWGTYLVEASTGHRFWSSGGVIVVEPEHPVTEAAWLEVQHALADGIEPPIWFDFLFDAEHRLSNGDLTGAVLSAAIGFESVMRTLVARHLPPEAATEQIVTDVLDNANLRFILNKRKKMRFWEPDWERRFGNFSLFQELMNQRDRIMHSGDTSALSVINWKEVIRSVTEFAYFVDDDKSQRYLGSD
jgi:hypothetical protein